MSRRTLPLGFSAGEPLSETVVEHRDTLRGVVIFLTPESCLKEPTDDTLRMLTRSAVPNRGIDSRLCFSLAVEEATLVVDNWRLSWLSTLYRATLLRTEGLCRWDIVKAGTVGDVSGMGRGPATSGFCHCRCDTCFSEALSSSATICSKLGDCEFTSGARKIGLVTKTELLADS